MLAKEITAPVNLCKPDGSLNEDSIGWARKPYVHCNVKGSFLRKKKWNYWCVTSSDVLFSATISHIDYAAVLFVYVLDMHTKKFHEQTVLVPLGTGVVMPDEVHASLQYEGKNLKIQFLELEQGTRIVVNSPNFSGQGKSLQADITLYRPENYESLNVVVPWSHKRFQFTSKQPALPAEGKVVWEDQEYVLRDQDAFGCLDFGRGIWKYQSTWNWASGSGICNGKVIGLNFGGQWTDGTGQNENGVVVDGKLYKIHDDIVWEYDKSDFMKPWKLTTANGDQVSLTFTPFFERVAATKAVIIESEVHQMIGRFQGTIHFEDLGMIEIDSLIGWAEDHMARW